MQKVGKVVSTRFERRSSGVDLKQHLTLCEMNYYRFLRLLPGLRDGVDQWDFKAGLTEATSLLVCVKILDPAPYTTTIEVLQSRNQSPEPRLVVRLYHDANLAEIVSWDEHRNWMSQYSYPNPQMYQMDEKLALNRFLGEWLTYCRDQGYACRKNCEEVLVTNK